MAPNTRAAEPTGQPAQAQTAPVQADGNTVGSLPAQTIQPAAPAALIATFEQGTGTGENIPVARCSLQLGGALQGVSLYGFTFWKAAKSGDIQIRFPGQRGFQDLRPSVVSAVFNGRSVDAADPAGKAALEALETGLMAAFYSWRKHGEKFAGGRVPVSIAGMD